MLDEESKTDGTLYVDGKPLARAMLENPPDLTPQKDSWLIDGDCMTCRKKRYCSKPCTKRKRVVREEMNTFIGSRALERMMKRRVV